MPNENETSLENRIEEAVGLVVKEYLDRFGTNSSIKRDAFFYGTLFEAMQSNIILRLLEQGIPSKLLGRLTTDTINDPIAGALVRAGHVPDIGAALISLVLESIEDRNNG